MESLSQERLDIEGIRQIMLDTAPIHIKQLQAFWLMADEIKRLQAIEASLTNGKAAVKDIYDYWEAHDGPAIYSGQTIASIIYDVVNHLQIKIKGVNEHE